MTHDADRDVTRDIMTRDVRRDGERSPPDYAELLDAQTLAFVARTNAWYPPDTADAPVERQRAIYDAMCREFFAGYPDGVAASDGRVGHGERAVPVRRYRCTGAGREPAALLLYFHGGGFVVGGLESHDDVCAELCERTGNPVVSVDYRLAPEHRHPAAFEDALTAFAHVAGHDELPILLCGDSAGGTLAAALAGATREHPRAAIGQLLIYPGLGGATDRGSCVVHANAPLLSTREVAYYRDIRAGDERDLHDPAFAPLRDRSFAGLPPTVVVSAACDPLSDDGRRYCEAIRAAGGRARHFDEPGLVHGYLRARHTVERARASFERIVALLRELADPPSG